MKLLKLTALISILFYSLLSFTDERQDFCAGYSEGYKAIKGDSASVPWCPPNSIIPPGGSAYRQGIRAGIRAAGK